MSFVYKRTVVIDHTKVSGDQINFPILFSQTDATFKTVGNGGHVQNVFGYDLCFFSDSGATTLLNWAVEAYDNTTGNFIAWIKIPALSSSADTTIYLFYGDATVNTPQGNGTAVWDSSFKGVWHFQTFFGSPYYGDNTTNGINGTAHGTPAAIAAQVDGGAVFNGSTDYIDFTNNSLLDVSSGNITLQFWVNPTVIVDGTNIMARGSFFVGGWIIQWDGGGNKKLNLLSNQSFAVSTLDANTTLSINTWNFVCLVKSGTTWTWYYNGNPDGSNTLVDPVSSTEKLSLATYLGAGTFMQGSFDEFRFSSSARTAGWILTDYNSQGNPSTFSTLGTEQSNASAAFNNQMLLFGV